MELQDRVVVITGGGSGIGEAMARAAHSAGARHVVVADLHGAEAERVAADMSGTAVEIDVRDESAIRRWSSRHRTPMARSTCSCRTPASSPGGIEDSNEAIQGMWEVHCMAHIYAARAVLPSMIANGEGYLLNTASAAGLLHTDRVDELLDHESGGGVDSPSGCRSRTTTRASGCRVLCPQAVATNIVANSPQNHAAEAAPPTELDSGTGVAGRRRRA